MNLPEPTPPVPLFKKPVISAHVEVDDNGSVTSAEGLPEQVDVLQALVGSLAALGSRALAELGAGQLNRLVLDGTAGRLVFSENPKGGFRAHLVDADAPLGLALASVQHT